MAEWEYSKVAAQDAIHLDNGHGHSGTCCNRLGPHSDATATKSIYRNVVVANETQCVSMGSNLLDVSSLSRRVEVGLVTVEFQGYVAIVVQRNQQ